MAETLATLMTLMKKSSEESNDEVFVTVGGAGSCIGGVFIPVDDLRKFSSLTLTKKSGSGTFSRGNFRYTDSDMNLLSDTYDITLGTPLTIPTIPQNASYVRIIIVISTTNNNTDIYNINFS